MNDPTLHPNLAKLAAAYDEILERLDRGQVTSVAARAEIAQLETRDDQGVRWSIDPDSGEWVRKTAMGDYEYDAAPPAYGYMTPDAFDYTHQPQAFNPADRVQLAAVNEQLELAPHALAGATRTQPAAAGGAGLASLLERASAASTKAKAIAGAGTVLVLAVVLHGCSAQPAPTPTPAPSPTKAAAPAKAGAPAKKHTPAPVHARH